MFQKKINFRVHLLLLALALYVILPSELLAADPSVRIEMERATREIADLNLRPESRRRFLRENTVWLYKLDG